MTAYPPSPPVVNDEQRNWALIAHLIPLIAMWFSVGFLGFVAGIIVYFIARDRGPLARSASAEALNIQFTAFLCFLVSLALVLVVVGIFLIPLVFLWASVLHIMCMVKESRGETWRAPLVLRVFS